MADKAQSTLSASIFMDEVKSRLRGEQNYEPAVAIAASAGEGWVFSENTVDESASTNILGTGDNYMGGLSAVAVGDKIKWIAIKNMSTVITEGIGVDFNAGTAAIALKTTMFLGPGEVLICKPVNATVADLHVRSCTMDGTYGYPSAQGTADVKVQVAAILENVG